MGPGTVVDRYVLDAKLGEGGMAEVYRAAHAELGTAHALKILHVTSPAVQERTLQEGRIQATMRHPNIVAVTDVARIDGRPVLVMEYIEGPALDGLLKEYQPNLAQADELARGIIAGVKAAHAKGLIHRDLKPANIMLAVEGNRIVPKVTDFGMAKVLDEANSSGRTASGSALGTPAFMAPEQVRDAKNVDSRADIFSLGCILYELVSGAPAFYGDGIHEVFLKAYQEEFRPIRELVPSIPKRMEDAINGAIKADPNERIPNCDALLDAWLGDADEVTNAGPAWEPEHLDLVKTLGPKLPVFDATATLASQVAFMPGQTAIPPLGGASVTMTGMTMDAPAGVVEATAAPPVAGTTTVELGGPAAVPWILAAGLGGSLLVVIVALLVVVGLFASRGGGSTSDGPEADPVVVGADVPEDAPDGGDAVPADPTDSDETADVDPADEPPADQPPADKPPADKPPADKPPADKPPAPPATAVQVTGVDRAYLIAKDGTRYPAGAVPPGTYQLSVFFDPAKATDVKMVTVQQGQTVAITCTAMMRSCR